VAKRWSLVFQENFTINQGDLVEGSVISNTVFFQPDFSEDASGIKKVSGFGDIQMVALFKTRYLS